MRTTTAIGDVDDMAERARAEQARQLLAAVLPICGVATDDGRLAHLAPLTASLLVDGELLTARVRPEAEPLLVARLETAEPPEVSPDA